MPLTSTLCLAFDVQIEEPAESEAPAPAITRRTRSMALVVRERTVHCGDRLGRAVLLDFDRRRRVQIDQATGRFVDDSLFGHVGLRHFELPNRERIRSAIQSGGGDGSAFAPVLVEHQLSVRNSRGGRPATTISLPGAPGAPPQRSGLLRSLFQRRQASDIEGRILDGAVVYSADSRRLLSHASQGLDVPCDAVAGFVQFLRYEYGGHPHILDQVAKLGWVPKELHLHALHPAPFDRGEVIVRTAPLRTAGDPGPPHLAGLREVARFEDIPEDDAVLRIPRSPSPARDEPAIDQRLHGAIADVRSGGDPLRGLLSFFELTLETGIGMPPEMAEVLRRCGDAPVRLLLSSLDPTTDERSTREALAAQRRVREAAQRPSAVLDAFEAGLRAMLGERRLAKQLLARAIAANPRLTGAYKQLGDLYLAAYDAGHAWRCWDIARSIAPAHPLLSDVTKLEDMILAAHPEYFRPAARLSRDGRDDPSPRT